MKIDMSICKVRTEAGLGCRNCWHWYSCQGKLRHRGDDAFPQPKQKKEQPEKETKSHIVPIPKQKPHHKWTVEELNVLNDPAITSREIAKMFNVQVNSVRKYRSRNKIKAISKPGRENSWTEEEKALAEDISLGSAEVSKLTGRSKGAIRAYRYQHGIKMRRGIE